MQGAIIKTYFTKAKGIKPEDIVNVTITPCVAKKFEIDRAEFSSAGKYLKKKNMPDNDYIITTVELAKWCKEEGINLKSLKEEPFDELLGQASGAGVIFGNTGGVMEAALRTAYSYLTGEEPSSLVLNFKPVRGLADTKEAEVEFAGKKLRVVAVYGLANTRKLLDKIKKGAKYDFVEIMTCPGGCIGGGGQPKHIGEEEEVREARIKALYARDRKLAVRASHLNPEIKALYDNFLSKPGSKLAKQLLHTSYIDRSGDLSVPQVKEDSKMKTVKYRCKICGEVFEVPEGQEAACPLCKMKGDKLERI